MSSKPKKVVIKKSTKPEKKLMAVFSLDNGRKKTTHFGSAGMDDYTKTKDDKQKARYLERHRRRENWNDPMTAGALSRWILWNKPTRRESIQAFKKRFNLS
tara:strand:- start:1702 stop:2004 length:303 start_codon:yes stop_codon:yes gene_type:complete